MHQLLLNQSGASTIIAESSKDFNPGTQRGSDRLKRSFVESFKVFQFDVA